MRLQPDQRAEAVVLNDALGKAALMAKTRPSIEDLETAVWSRLESAPSATVESVDIRDADTLEVLSGTLDRPAVILLAVRYDTVLLIDQRVVAPDL